MKLQDYEYNSWENRTEEELVMANTKMISFKKTIVELQETRKILKEQNENLTSMLLFIHGNSSAFRDYIEKEMAV